MITFELCIAAGGVSREYFIAVETVKWQYADPAYNFCYGRNYSFDENAVVRPAPAAHVSPPTLSSSRAFHHPCNLGHMASAPAFLLTSYNSTANTKPICVPRRIALD